MPYELKDGEGGLFKNKNRKTDKHPAARGQAKIDGVLYWVSAWTNQTKDGEKYQALKFERKDDQPSPRRDQMDRMEREADRNYDRSREDEDSDLPF